MMNKDIIENKKARFEYELLKSYEAGVVLMGSEIKEVVNKNINLNSSWVKIYNGEAFIVNFEIANVQNPGRDKKLLLNKQELKTLTGIVEQKGLSLIPSKIYLKDNKVKIQFYEARGKKLHDKRQSIKARDIDRENAQILKNNNKI